MAAKLPRSGGSARREEPGPEIACFSINRPKAYMALLAHLLLPAFIFWRLLQGEAPLREDLFAIVVVLGVFGFAAWSVVRDLRTPRDAVVLEEEGFRDFRRGPQLVRWEDVAEASMKRGVLSRGVKIVLVDGSRADIDTGLLGVKPRKLTALVVEALRARAA